MKYFGFFNKADYKDTDESFDDFKKIKNNIPKEDVVKYLRSLPIGAIAPMSISDMFTGEHLEQAGLYIDGDFTFPLEFCTIMRNMILEYLQITKNISKRAFSVVRPVNLSTSYNYSKSVQKIIIDDTDEDD
ncbi:MAG: hypothetical protein ACI4CT_09415 [Lachnospiraceae bacterium]